MSATNLTPDEVLDTLTGHDEMAITQHFGKTVAALGEHDPSMFGRALVFVLLRRDNRNDDDARNEVLNMSFKDVTTYFGDGTEEVDEPGKDETDSAPEPEPEPQPATSLSSVS